MSLSDQNIIYVLTLFDAGISPSQISNILLSAGLTELKLMTILWYLRKNGRLSDNDLLNYTSQDDLLQSCKSNYTAGCFNSMQTRQGFDTPDLSTSDTMWVDPGPTMPWDTLADRFTLAAHVNKKLPSEICALLRCNGYNVTQAQVLTSLNRQGVITGC